MEVSKIQQHPPLFKDIPLKEKHIDEFVELYALWQREYPEGVGVDLSIKAKRNTKLFKNVEDFTLAEYNSLFQKIENYYSKLKNDKKNKNS